MRTKELLEAELQNLINEWSLGEVLEVLSNIATFNYKEID